MKAIEVVGPASFVERPYPGRAFAGQEVNLSFRVPGPLVELPVKVGDEVEAGQLVAQIDPTDFESALNALRGQLQAAQADSVRAQADFTRIENTFKEDPGATTEMAVDRVRQLRDSAAGRVRSLQASVKGAEDQLSYTSLKAPFAGSVVETYVENFETVRAKQNILRIVDPTQIEFRVSVPENQIAYAPFVTELNVTFDALPGVAVSAKIKEIGKEATQATRTYPVTLVMEQPEGVEILPGMAGEALAKAQLPEEAALVGIQIPPTALFTEEDPTKSYVWVIDRDTNLLARREVTVDGVSDLGSRIAAGLEPGEWIVVAGVSLLSDGEEVRIAEPVAREIQ